jgi:UDP-N-acetylmuramoyl-tripeptide--D-alanyl-D-alanine ligase
LKVEFHTKLKSIVEWTGGELLTGDSGKEINSITTDSRMIGKDSLFVPVIGEKFDGHRFINELTEKKSIAAFLTMRKGDYQAAANSGIGAVFCDDTLCAYGRLASGHRSEMKAKLIGITGTNGKTTTKELIWAILSSKYKTLKNEKNYNNEIGVPYTMLGLRNDHELAVIEMGMNHPGELDRLSKIAKPDIALITNVGEGHLEFLGNVENVAFAKSEIMHGMKRGSTVILNSDTQCFDILSKKASDMGIKVKTFGLYNNADVKPSKYKMYADSLQLEYNNNFYNVPLYGLHNAYNALAAISIAEILKVETDIIQKAFLNFKNIDMRSQIINSGYTIINDTYNSNPLSARYALTSLKEIFPEKRKVAILSDMKELGDSSGYYHSDIGKQAHLSGVDLLLTWGELAQEIAAGARNSGMPEVNVKHFFAKNELIDFARKNIHDDDVILVKGSRSMKMEEVVEALVH